MPRISRTAVSERSTVIIGVIRVSRALEKEIRGSSRTPVFRLSGEQRKWVYRTRLRDNAPPRPSVLLPDGGLLCVHATPSRNSDLRYIREKCKRPPRVTPLQVLPASRSWITRASSQTDLIIDAIKYFPPKEPRVFSFLFSWPRDIINFSLRKCGEKRSRYPRRTANSRSVSARDKDTKLNVVLVLSVDQRASCARREDINYSCRRFFPSFRYKRILRARELRRDAESRIAETSSATPIFKPPRFCLLGEPRITPYV